MATVYQRASIEKTDAGAFSTNLGINKFAGREDPEAAYEGKVLNAALVNWAATQGRVFITRVTLTFLYATGVLAFLGFLSTLSADSDQGDSAADHKKRYVCALSVVVNLVAVAHYKMITKIRNYSFGGSHKGEVFAGLEWTAFTPHDKKIAIGVEMAVDSIRHSDWAITLVFLTYKIYYLCGVESDGVTPKTGSIFESPGAAAGCALLMVVLSAIVRIGTDEIWDFKKNLPQTIVAAILWGVSLLIMILIIVDIDQAVELNKGVINVELFKSFYLVWIGYPIVSAISIFTRLWMACMKPGYGGETPEQLCLFKDVAYGFLDSWSKGVFAMWTAYTAFNMHLLNAPAAASLN